MACRDRASNKYIESIMACQKFGLHQNLLIHAYNSIYRLCGNFSSLLRHVMEIGSGESLSKCLDKVIFIDEPSIGLDPISRRNLWSVVKRVKQDRTIILTSHSTEEVETLCDRVGILISGSLQCIGNSKEMVHYFNESLDNNLRITRDTCSKDLFEMYRALNLL
nr:abc transporter a family member 12 [Quercus suber]